MLKNDPPPGTRVRFLREIRTAKANDIATLKGPLRKYLFESVSDEFEVEFRGGQQAASEAEDRRVKERPAFHRSVVAEASRSRIDQRS